MKAKPPSNPRTEEDNSLIRGGNWFSALLERFFAATTPPCTRVIRLVSDSLERPLPFRTRLKMRAHFLVCCYCRRYEQQVHRLRRFTIAVPEHLEEVQHDSLPEDVKQRIKARLRDAS